jgi:transcriptional regulator with XRE-family HTH domain
MKTGPQTRRRGQSLRGHDTEWSQLRIARDLSVTELAELSGVARSIVGLIDQGRLTPGPDEAARLLAVLTSEGTYDERTA